MQSLNDFLEEIRKHLSLDNMPLNDSADYVDLAEINFDKEPNIHMLGFPEPNPVISVFEMVIEQISLNRVDRVQLGINELLKYYLTNFQKVKCQEIMYRVELIFERCLQPDFPYTDKLWKFINKSLQNFCLYLMRLQKYESAKVSLETLAHLGKKAAQEGLPTAVTQSALRMVEINAQQLNQEALAAKAKNYRFNLEI